MHIFMDIICLILWVLVLIFGILAWCGIMTIHPLSYICAAASCCLHYIEKLVEYKVKESKKC